MQIGFKIGNRYNKNSQNLDLFLDRQNVGVVHCTLETADLCSDIKLALKKVGRPIPSNDIWIAAQAIEMGSVLLTYDKHFLHIQGLRLWK